MPKISVVIPIYNAERFLSETLDSVIGQSLRDIEIICVDDLSTDGSRVLMEGYANSDERVKIIPNNEHLNAGGSRNAGIRAANGEYIVFLDADDILLEGALDHLYGAAARHGADYVKTKTDCLDAETGETYQTDYYDMKDIPSALFDRPLNLYGDPVFQEKFGAVPVTPWGAACKRSFLIENKIEFNDFVCVNDRSFSRMVLIRAQRIVLTDAYTVRYRVGIPTSLIAARAQHFDCQFASYRLIEQMTAAIPETPEPPPAESGGETAPQAPRPGAVKKRILAVELADLLGWYLRHADYPGLTERVRDFLKETDFSVFGGDLFQYDLFDDLAAVLFSDRDGLGFLFERIAYLRKETVAKAAEAEAHAKDAAAYSKEAAAYAAELANIQKTLPYRLSRKLGRSTNVS
jgi:glycosyltransferase involved in cell wall biosynthesis